MEGKRIFGSRLFLAVLAGLVILNSCFFAYQQRQTRIIGEICHQKLDEFSESTHKEVIVWCDEVQQAAWDAVWALEWDYNGEEEWERQASERLEEQYTYLIDYQGYLQKIDADALKLQSVSLFADPDSFGYKNTVKTAEDFAPMKAVSVTPGRDLAVTAVFEDKWTDYSIVILLFVVCALFAAERKEGLWPMIHAAPGGRWQLALKRVWLLLAAAFLGTVVLVGSKVLLSGWMYHGLGEWDRTLQSIPMFFNVPIPMTVGQFWLLYIVEKALGAFWIGLVLWAVLSAISNLGLALAASGLLLAVEYVCTLIPSYSMFAMARYVNIFSYVDFIGVFTRYLNLNVFGSLISGCDLVLWMLGLLCPVFIAVNLLIAQWKHPVAPMNRLLRWGNRLSKKINPRLPVPGEGLKLLWKRKGILLLVLLAIIVLRRSPPPREQVQWDPFIQQYQSQYAGPITEDTVPTLMSAAENSLNEGYSAALTDIVMQVQSAPEGAWLVPTAPYDAVFSGNLGNYHRVTALIVLLFTVLLLAPMGSQERQNGMTALLRSTGGRERLRWKKHLLLLTLVTVIWAGVYGAELYKIVTEHGTFQYLHAPACSLEVFREIPTSVSLGLILSAYYLLKLPVLVLVGELCFFLSNRCTKNRDAILLTGGVILLPAAIATIGSKVGTYLSFLILISGQ